VDDAVACARTECVDSIFMMIFHFFPFLDHRGSRASDSGFRLTIEPNKRSLPIMRPKSRLKVMAVTARLTLLGVVVGCREVAHESSSSKNENHTEEHFVCH
jgi:hypothetical protein